MPMSKISIFIRAQNEAQMLGQTLCEIRAQNRKPDEIILMDNESQDSTCRVAKDRGAIVHSIKRDEFTYGRALNHAAKVTHGDIIVFLSAHSPPINLSWLQNLVAPIENGKAQVSFGRQVPIPGLNHLEEWIIYRTFPKRPNIFKSMLGLQKISFSNANSAVLASILRDYPFREDLAFNEDYEWARRLEAKGFRILYRPDAVVYHSHQFKPTQLEQRMERVGYAKQQLGIGQVYRNEILCQCIKWVTMTVDFIYCVSQGYWRTIPDIARYRSEYFKGLKHGLTQKL